MKRFRYLLIPISALILFSCSPQKVLVLTDPVFDYFASEQIDFYKVERLLIFLKGGFMPEFIEMNDGNLPRIQERLNNGEYHALVTGYLNYFDLNIPSEMKTILVGGSGEIRYESSFQVLSSNIDAYRLLSRQLYKEWKGNGKIPVTVVWKSPRAGDDELETLLSEWNDADRDILKKNMLILDESDKEIQNKIESFFRRYNFSEQNVLITGACSPVLDNFLKALPGGVELELILAIPDNPVLPETVHGIITPAYKMILKGSVKALRDYSPGGIVEIQNIYKNK